MQNTTHPENSVVLSMEKIIDLVRALRNELIKDLLYQDKFTIYFKESFNKDLSKIKTEFARRELKELLIQPVDLVHYSKLIHQIKETNTASISEKNYTLFYEELNRIFSKYAF